MAGTRHPGVSADQRSGRRRPHATVGLIGIGFPVPALKYLNQREAFWAKKAGLTVLGTQDNPSDDVTGGEKAANGLVQRYSDMKAIIGYNDPSAVGASIAARSAGRKITIVGLNGDSAGLQAVKSGKLVATVRVDPVGWGVETTKAAYSLITKQNLPLPKILVRPARARDEGERGQGGELEGADRLDPLVGSEAEPVLRAVGVHKRFGGVHALRGAH